jgi:hypothetical protein
MFKNEDLVSIRKEFFELYRLLSKQSILKDDVISVGNLALFVDYSLHRYQWLEKKKQIQLLANKGDKNEVNMILTKHLYDIAIRLEISDNLAYKLKKMTSSYEANKLEYFDVVLDAYEFPEWFKRVMAYLPIPEKRELYLRLSERIKQHSNFDNIEHELSIAYFVDSIYKDRDYLELIATLEDLLREDNENEIAWFMASNIFRYYYPEMEKRNRKQEQLFALHKLKSYKESYHLKKLNAFDVFTDTIKKELIAKFKRDM